MAKERNYFALGLWVIVVFVLFFGALIFIGGRHWGRTFQDYTVRYPVTYALPDEIKPGAFVYCGGAAVGQVTGIELQRLAEQGQDESLWACLDIQVDQIVPLRGDCRIVARGPLLGGGGKLVISDPGRNGSLLAAGATIDGSETGSFDAALDLLNAELDPTNRTGLLAMVKTQLDPADLGSIVAKVHGSLDDLNEVTRGLARQLDPDERDALMRKLHLVLDNVNAATGQLRAELADSADDTLLAKVHGGLDSLNRALTDVAAMLEEDRPVVYDTLVGLRRTTGTFEQGIIEPIAAELNRENVASLLSQLHASFEKVNQSLDNIKVLSERARTMVVLNEERFNHLMMNVSETAGHLKSASKDLRRNPWRLFYRPSLEETKQLNIFDAAREFSEAAARLDDSATRLDALVKSYEGNVPADEPELAEIVSRLEATFQDYTKAEEALWKQLDVE